MDFKQIQELIRQVSKAGVSEVKIEQGDFKITIKTKSSEYVTVTSAMPQPVMHHIATPVAVNTEVAKPASVQETAATESKEAPVENNNANIITIKSPMIGTFYRSPGPDKEPFVKVGDVITKGNVLCVVEAMKLFNEIESEFDGKIVKVLVDDATPIEYDQALFLIEKI